MFFFFFSLAVSVVALGLPGDTTVHGGCAYHDESSISATLVLNAARVGVGKARLPVGVFHIVASECSENKWISIFSAVVVCH